MTSFPIPQLVVPDHEQALHYVLLGAITWWIDTIAYTKIDPPMHRDNMLLRFAIMIYIQFIVWLLGPQVVIVARSMHGLGRNLMNA